MAEARTYSTRDLLLRGQELPTGNLKGMPYFKFRDTSAGLAARADLVAQFDKEIKKVRAQLARTGLDEATIENVVARTRQNFISGYGKILAGEQQTQRLIAEQRKAASSARKRAIWGGLTGTVLGRLIPSPKTDIMDIINQLRGGGGGGKGIPGMTFADGEGIPDMTFADWG